MAHRFVIADVFTATPFGGNQLAVFPDAGGLSDRAMQALARLGLVDAPAGVTTVLFEEGVGLVPVEIRLDGDATFARLVRAAEIERPPVERPVRAAAAALSLPERAVLATWSAGVGVPFCFVHLADPDTVDRAVLERAAWTSEFARAWAPHLFLFAGPLDAGSRLYARMFAPALGIEEDPATGSGGAALAGCLAERLPTDGSFAWTIDQGVAMGRPSRLEVSAETRGRRAVQVTVGGATVLVGEGRMSVPPGY